MSFAFIDDFRCFARRTASKFCKGIGRTSRIRFPKTTGREVPTCFGYCLEPAAPSSIFINDIRGATAIGLANSLVSVADGTSRVAIRKRVFKERSAFWMTVPAVPSRDFTVSIILRNSDLKVPGKTCCHFSASGTAVIHLCRASNESPITTGSDSGRWFERASSMGPCSLWLLWVISLPARDVGNTSAVKESTTRTNNAPPND